MMDFPVKVSCVILLTIAMANCEKIHTNIIKTISFKLSSYLTTNCFFMYHKYDDDSQANFEAFKALSSETRQFVGWYTFEERDLENNCAKPMNILIGEELKESFIRFTERDSMTDEVWVVYLTTSSTFDFFNGSRPPFDAEIIVVEIQSLQEVQIWEVYAVDDDFPLRIKYFGNWSEEGGLTHPELPLYDRRSDLEGKVIRIGSNENWPICSFSDGKWDGYMPRIWKEVENLINCTTVPLRSVDDATGLQLENGSWNGLMGMLINGEIDIIAAELTLTKDRVDFIEYGYPAISARGGTGIMDLQVYEMQDIENCRVCDGKIIREYNLYLLGFDRKLVFERKALRNFELDRSTQEKMRLPPKVPESSIEYQVYFKALGYRLQWQAIFKPLSLSTWLALFAWTVVGSICISISFYGCISYGFKEDRSLNFTRGESFFFILQSLCQQGYPVVPKSLSCRILFMTAYALSTIMIPSYSASLISSLTSQAPIRPFDSLEGMVEDGKYNLLVKKNSAAFTQFSKATDTLYTEAYTKLVDKIYGSIPFEDTSLLIDDFVCKRKHYALYGVDLIVNLKMEHKKPRCFILTLSKPLSPVFVALGLRMDSPLSRIIDYKLLKLKAIGAISRIEYNLRPLPSDSTKDIGFRQVEVEEIFQVFFLLLIGMIISIIILAIELMVWKSRGYGNGQILTKNQQLSENHRSYMIYLDVFMD